MTKGPIRMFGAPHGYDPQDWERHVKFCMDATWEELMANSLAWLHADRETSYQFMRLAQELRDNEHQRTEDFIRFRESLILAEPDRSPDHAGTECDKGAGSLDSNGQGQ